jgi:hypothetical protein
VLDKLCGMGSFVPYVAGGTGEVVGMVEVTSGKVDVQRDGALSGYHQK